MSQENSVSKKNRDRTAIQWARMIQVQADALLEKPEETQHRKKLLDFYLKRLLYVMSWTEFGDRDFDELMLEATNNQIECMVGPILKNN